MAVRGRRPNTPRLAFVKGKQVKPYTGPSPSPAGPPVQPDWLSEAAKRVWADYIVRADWLTWADEIKAIMFCNLMAEYKDDPAAMIAAKLRELRHLGSELGFDPVARTRMGGGGGEKDGAFTKYA